MPLSQDIVIPGSLDLIEVIAALEKSKPLQERRFLTAFFGRADLVPRGIQRAMARDQRIWEMAREMARDLGKCWEIPYSFEGVFCWGICCEMIISWYFLGFYDHQLIFYRILMRQFTENSWLVGQQRTKKQRHHLVNWGPSSRALPPNGPWSRCEVLIRGLEVWMFERNSSP